MTVSRALQPVGASATCAHFVNGWFEDTLFASKGEIGSIALLHVDCDWYESVRLVLAELYDQIVPGGVIAIDDYQHWLGCRKAVDEILW
jgi:Macrocin-O-methyltransferase (TylF)